MKIKCRCNENKMSQVRERLDADVPTEGTLFFSKKIIIQKGSADTMPTYAYTHAFVHMPMHMPVLMSIRVPMLP